MQESIETIRAELEERLRFETLLAETSSRFVNVPADQVDGEIEAAQRRICEFLNLDRATLWQPSEKEPRMLLTHAHHTQGAPRFPKEMNGRELFPWIRQKIQAGETVTITKISDLPPEAGRDQESCRLYGSKSAVIVPVSIGRGPVFAALTFAVTREERSWPETVVKGLQLIAQVFANALARKQAEKALRESEARLSLATNAGGMGLWVMELDTGRVWVTTRIRELFHFAPDEELNYEKFLQVIHPEDRQRFHHTVQQTLQSGEDLLIDCRIIQPDGTIRWIIARGQRYLQSTGEPDRMMGVGFDVTERKRTEEQLKKCVGEIEERNAELLEANKQLRQALSEIKTLKEKLETENIYFHQEVRLKHQFSHIIGQSNGFKYVLHRAEQVAPTNKTVLIFGETGTGKELMAAAIHQMSPRKDRPLITVNCAALPANLIESELFGREKGAFTGADTRQVGRFEIANGSTLCLDEIGELSLEVQAKLLRVIQHNEFERLGSSHTIKVDVRIIATTNRNLEEEVRAGRFRQDLYYRLNIFPITIPPLRQRKEDIPILVHGFIERYSKELGKPITSIQRESMKALQDYPWPGNIRELENVIERTLILCPGPVFQLSDKLEASCFQVSPVRTLEELERDQILRTLSETRWRINGKKGAATILGLHPSTLRARMHKLGIRRPELKLSN